MAGRLCLSLPDWFRRIPNPNDNRHGYPNHLSHRHPNQSADRHHRSYFHQAAATDRHTYRYRGSLPRAANAHPGCLSTPMIHLVRTLIQIG